VPVRRPCHWSPGHVCARGQPFGARALQAPKSPHAKIGVSIEARARARVERARSEGREAKPLPRGEAVCRKANRLSSRLAALRRANRDGLAPARVCTLRGARGVASIRWPRNKGRKTRARPENGRGVTRARTCLAPSDRCTCGKTAQPPGGIPRAIAGSARNGGGPVDASGVRGSDRRGARAGQARSRHASRPTGQFFLTSTGLGAPVDSLAWADHAGGVALLRHPLQGMLGGFRSREGATF